MSPEYMFALYEPQSQLTVPSNTCDSEDSDQPAHSRSLIRIFPGRISISKGREVSSCGQCMLKLDCADAQVDFSLRFARKSEFTTTTTTINSGNSRCSSSSSKIKY